jgi:hypothetical protein
MPETVGMLATVGEASKSRATRNNRNAGSQQHDRNTGNSRIGRQQEYHGLILRKAKNSTSHSREANNTQHQWGQQQHGHQYKQDTAEQLIAGVVDTGEKHLFAIISANFRKNAKRPQWCTWGPGGHWFMKKTWSQKSRVRLPLNDIYSMFLLLFLPLDAALLFDVNTAIVGGYF